MDADFRMLKWLSAEVKIRSFSRRDGSRSPSFSGSSFSHSTAWFRASRRAWKLDWLPPEVNTPSAESPSPSCPAAHEMSLRSIMVAPALWSQVSIEEFTADRTASATSAGITTGQFRCAAYLASWK